MKKIALILSAALWLIFNSSSCSNMNKIKFIIPNSYQGYATVLWGQRGKDKILSPDGWKVIKFSDDGIAFTGHKSIEGAVIMDFYTISSDSVLSKIENVILSTDYELIDSLCKKDKKIVYNYNHCVYDKLLYDRFFIGVFCVNMFDAKIRKIDNRGIDSMSKFQEICPPFCKD